MTDMKLLLYRLFATSSTVSPLLKEFEIFGELFESFVNHLSFLIGRNKPHSFHL